MLGRAFTELWRYRHFILSSIVTEYRTRFARSRLGTSWMLVGPLVQSAVLAVVFSKFLGAQLAGAKDEFAFAVYILAGMAAWSMFAESLNRNLVVFRDHAHFIQSIRFPNLCLPLIVLGSTLLSHLFMVVALVAIYLVIGHGISVHILWLPLVTATVLLLAQGVGVIFGILNVFRSDIGHAFSIFIPLLFWCTPIIYQLDVVPAAWQPLFYLNAMVPMVLAYQDVLAFQRAPDLVALAAVAALAVGLNLLAMVMYRRARNDLVDAL